MPAIECLVCGTSAYTLGGGQARCHACGGEHFHSSLPGDDSTRFPPIYHRGEHASLIYNNERRMLDVLVPYVRGGFQLGQSLVGVCSYEQERLLRAALRFDEERQVQFVRPQDVYGSRVDSAATIARYEQLIAESSRPLRVFGGLDRPLAQAPDTVDQMAILENAHTDHLFESGMTALCLYDARLCSKELLDLAAGHDVLAGADRVYLQAA